MSKHVFLSVLATVIFTTPVVSAPLSVGQPVSPIRLDGDLGGKVSGEAWNSDDIAKSGKIISLFYVDPEEKKLNEPVELAYENAKFPPDKHASIAVINMAAAWYPNSMINSQLKKKQEQFPRTTYVKDIKKTLVKEWDLKDDSVNVVIFGRDGKPLFVKRGPMSTGEINELMTLIRANLEPK
jgi:predicted transcriptional regulator